MALYVSLINWTEQGVRTVKDTVERARGADKLAGQFGGRIRDIYWTMGPHDIVAVTEFPDDESASAFALTLAGMGNIRTSTSRAYTAEDMEGIVSRLG